MKDLGLLAIIILLPVAAADGAEIRLGERTTIRFATVEEGRKVLTAQDDYVRRMSPFDRSSRLKTAGEVSTDEYLNFVGRQVLEWKESERRHIEAVLSGLEPRLKKPAAGLPATVQFIKTSGVEEGGAAYTRADAVVLPQVNLAASIPQLEKLICHELFHVLSRKNPALRDKLYAAIGFVSCDEVELPAELAVRKITNPDAPRNDHCIRVRIDGRSVWAVPVLLSSNEKYDAQRGGEFFDYLQLRLLLVEREANSSKVSLLLEDGRPRLVEIRQTAEFYEQIGKNTKYIIHPEEILADNFALLALDRRDVASPEILKKMSEILAGELRVDTTKP